MKSGDSGPDVAQLQQALLESGYSIAPVELGIRLYGATTTEAVRQYQSDHGLDADGLAGTKTLRALSGTGGSFTAAGWRFDASTIPPQAIAVLKQAFTKVGTVEEPPGSNRGPEIDEWNEAAGIPLGSPWCAAFASAMYDHAEGGSPFGRLGSAYKILAWGRQHGRILPPSRDLLAGDIGIIMRDASHGHVVLVSNIKDTVGTFCTIEGNAGNAVRCLIRNRAALTAAVRPLNG